MKSATTKRRALTAWQKTLLEQALKDRIRTADGSEIRELRGIIQEAEVVLVDLPEGSRWS